MSPAATLFDSPPATESAWRVTVPGIGSGELVCFPLNFPPTTSVASPEIT